MAVYTPSVYGTHVQWLCTPELFLLPMSTLLPMSWPDGHLGRSAHPRPIMALRKWVIDASDEWLEYVWAILKKPPFFNPPCVSNCWRLTEHRLTDG